MPVNALATLVAGRTLAENHRQCFFIDSRAGHISQVAGRSPREFADCRGAVGMPRSGVGIDLQAVMDGRCGRVLTGAEFAARARGLRLRAADGSVRAVSEYGLGRILREATDVASTQSERTD